MTSNDTLADLLRDVKALYASVTLKLFNAIFTDEPTSPGTPLVQDVRPARRRWLRQWLRDRPSSLVVADVLFCVTLAALAALVFVTGRGYRMW